MSKASVQFDKLLEKATSSLLQEPDWGSILTICDLIQQKQCPAKYAVAAIKKKIHSQNLHEAIFGLLVIDSVVKNCGSTVTDEVATKQFMEELREVAKTTQHENVRKKILEICLSWADAFRKLPTHRTVQDVVNSMKADGVALKPVQESEAMFVADTAPERADGECCHGCRTELRLVVGKHHCRACGQIFCYKCSAKVCTLPKYGIEKEVRVCDSCFEKYGRVPNKTNSNMTSKERIMSTYTPATEVASFPLTHNDKGRSNSKDSSQKSVEVEDPVLARYWENRSKDNNFKKETGGANPSCHLKKKFSVDYKFTELYHIAINQRPLINSLKMGNFEATSILILINAEDAINNIRPTLPRANSQADLFED